jgi:GNAT superfamily N-acetyltransferase
MGVLRGNPVTPHVEPQSCASRTRRSRRTSRPRGKESDAAALAGELGYPTEAEAMERRLESLEWRADHAVFAAERRGLVRGWIHVASGFLLAAGETAATFGLVVDAAARGSGLGRQLIAAAERWSRARGSTAMSCARTSCVPRLTGSIRLWGSYPPRQVCVKPLVTRPEHERSD